MSIQEVIKQASLDTTKKALSDYQKNLERKGEKFAKAYLQRFLNSGKKQLMAGGDRRVQSQVLHDVKLIEQFLSQ